MVSSPALPLPHILPARINREFKAFECLQGSEKVSSTSVHNGLAPERVSLVQRPRRFFRLSLTVSPDPQTLQFVLLVTDASRSPRSISLRPLISQIESVQGPSVTMGAYRNVQGGRVWLRESKLLLSSGLSHHWRRSFLTSGFPKQLRRSGPHLTTTDRTLFASPREASFTSRRHHFKKIERYQPIDTHTPKSVALCRT